MRSEEEIQLEKDAREKARRHNPGIFPIVKIDLRTDDIFGIVWLIDKIKKMKAKSRKNTQAIAFIVAMSLAMTSCAGIHATTGADGGSSLMAFNLGGKQMMAGVRSPAVEIDQYYTDTEAAFKTFATMAALAYGVHQIAGAYKAVTTAKTAAETTKAVELGKQATSVTNTKTTADVIKAVGVPGEVPIAPVALP